MGTTQISPTSSNSSVYATAQASLPPAVESAGLTPDAMFVYLSTQLSSVDEDVKGRMKNQQDAVMVKNMYTAMKTISGQHDQAKLDTTVAEDLAKLKGLPEPQSAAVRDGIACLEQFQIDHCNVRVGFSFAPGEKVAFADARMTDRVMHDRPGQGGWADQIDQQTGTAKAGNTVAGSVSQGPAKPVGKDSDWDGVTAEIESKASGLNSQMELDMIQIQSLMSKRQTMVQLSTNIVKSLDQGSEAIVGNIK